MVGRARRWRVAHSAADGFEVVEAQFMLKLVMTLSV
jgi:hypothetical protein